MTAVVDPPMSLERQMSKHKPAKSKRARSPKIAARAQRNKQAIVRRPEGNFLRSAAAGATGRLHDDSKQRAPLVEDPVVALQDEFSQKMRINDPEKTVSFSLVTANMQPYQGKLLEMVRANMQLTFELSQRLATIKSPIEFFVVIAEFTGRRINMFAKYSMASYPFWGSEAFRGLTALPGR
jgi:hypothetical protein